jgi:hypothetical protein
LSFAVPEPTPLPIPTPAEPHARDRDACAVCRSPLSPDARYCLQCGARRAGARLEFLDVLDEQPGRATAPALAATARADVPARTARLDVLRTWPFGLTAVVLLALLIGLVAGRWLSDRDATTAATQVIRVEGAGATPAAAAPAATITTPSTTSSSKATKAGKKTASPITAPKKITRESEQKALDDTSGNENLAPEDDNPDGANFDEIK